MSAKALSQSLVWPMAVGYFVISAVLSVNAIQIGLDWWVYPLMSLWVYAGSSQIAILAMVSAGQGLFIILATVFALNIRHFFMALSLERYLRHLPMSAKLLWAFHLTDEVFALLINALRQRVFKPTLRQLFKVSTPCHMGWFLGALVGWFSIDLAEYLALYQFHYASTAMLLYILALLLKQRSDVIIACVAVTLTLLGLQFGLQESAFLIGALIAASIGAFCLNAKGTEDELQ